MKSMDSDPKVRPNLSEIKLINYSLLAELFLSGIFILYTIFQPSLSKSLTIVGVSKNRFIIIGLFAALIIVCIVLLTLCNKNKNFRQRIENVFNSSKFSSAFLLFFFSSSLLLLITYLPIVFENQVLAQRLRPLILFLILSALNPLIIKGIYSGTAINEYLSISFENTLIYLDRTANNKLMVILALLIGIPILFTAAFKFEYPAGFAGLFVLMSDLIKSNDFKLPVFIPYYGPGGIPFAYPPLGPYLLAGVTTLFHIGDLEYVRFFPPLLILLSIPPIYFIGYEITKSKVRKFFCSNLDNLFANNF